MIIRILYDIRFYLLLLAIVLFGFSLSFWCLCTGRYDHPTTISYKDIQQTASTNPVDAGGEVTAINVWYVAPSMPDATNDDPQGTYGFSTIQGAYLESFMYLTGQFSIVPFTACGWDAERQQVNVRVRSVAILLSALFAILVQIMMVNVLIALMTESYARLSERGVAQARLMQAQLIGESSGSLHQSLQRRLERGLENMQPRIIHVLRRAADVIYQKERDNLNEGEAAGDNDDAEGGGMPAAMVSAVRESAHVQTRRVTELLKGSAAEVDGALVEQEEALFRMRQAVDVLVAKTRKVLGQ